MAIPTRDAVSYLPRNGSGWVGDDARPGAGDGGFSLTPQYTSDIPNCL